MKKRIWELDGGHIRSAQPLPVEAVRQSLPRGARVMRPGHSPRTICVGLKGEAMAMQLTNRAVRASSGTFSMFFISRALLSASLC